MLGERPANLACRQYSKEYVKDEQAAHDAHRGIWAGSFEVPADWRRNHKGKHEVRLFHQRWCQRGSCGHSFMSDQPVTTCG